VLEFAGRCSPDETVRRFSGALDACLHMEQEC
jgi:hypothetical protein